jgi:hypothetical protein
MLEAIQAVKDKEMSCRGAAKHFRVPFATLRDRVAGTSGGDVGRPTELMKEEEAIIVERVILIGTWGFPLSRQDLQPCQQGVPGQVEQDHPLHRQPARAGFHDRIHEQASGVISQDGQLNLEGTGGPVSPGGKQFFRQSGEGAGGGAT